MRFSVIWRYRYVCCVLMRTSPAAVRVALHAWSSIRAWDEASDVGQGMTEVGVGRAPRAPKELIVGRRNDSVAASSAKGRLPLLCVSVPLDGRSGRSHSET